MQWMVMVLLSLLMLSIWPAAWNISSEVTMITWLPVLRDTYTLTVPTRNRCGLWGYATNSFSQSFSLQMMSFGQECSETVATVTLGNDASGSLFSRSSGAWRMRVVVHWDIATLYVVLALWCNVPSKNRLNLGVERCNIGCDVTLCQIKCSGMLLCLPGSGPLEWAAVGGSLPLVHSHLYTTLCLAVGSHWLHR